MSIRGKTIIAGNSFTAIPRRKLQTTKKRNRLSAYNINKLSNEQQFTILR